MERLGYGRFLAIGNDVFRGGLDLDFVLTQATAAWATGTVASGLRLYCEAEREEEAVKALPASRVPVALAQFANDTVSIRRLAEQTYRNLVACPPMAHIDGHRPRYATFTPVTTSSDFRPVPAGGRTGHTGAASRHLGDP